MKKNYKRVPFDIELAKNVQSGEVEGRIKCNIGEFRRILCFDAIGLYPVVALLYDGVDEVAFSFSKNGYFRSSTAMKLFIELPEEAPKHEFKVGDCVKIIDGGHKGNYGIILSDKIIHYPVEDNYCYFVQIPSIGVKADTSVRFIEKHEFKPFDNVLVRDGDGRKWRCSLFSHADECGYCCMDGHWNQCVPYEGCEHLVGTTDKPKKLC